ncbi:hypothetical protein B0H16DRAFT_1496317 [Mycena metata]|uniref:Arrestin-like N-terminal domain-containing protein n=1 Tax=Mycena metata TaxID=1033252 RepID=A0AAD7KDX8_9AGAR|nr:hypothetical protein B0H16DRAFT_1496317 [Mycena metata]
MSVALPAYAFSPTPSYASLPRTGDSTVEYTPRAGAAGPTSGTLTKNWRGVTIIFKNQEESSQSGIPTYGRNAIICGEIGLENPEAVLTICLKLQGRIDLSSSDCGQIEQTIVDEQHVLWDRAKSGRCPSVVGFALAFPTTYKDEDKLYRIPPSFETVILGSPLLAVKCAYKLRITITKTSGRLSLFKTTSKTYPIPLAFKPRTRPARPIIQDLSFISTLKAAPDEWHQMLVTIPTKEKAEVEPISCHFLIPSIATFCLSQPIPFHIQLCGSRDSLQLFYGSAPVEAPPPGSKRPRRRQYAAIVRVYVARQVYIEVHGKSSWRTIVVGEGALRPLPPTAYTDDADAREVSVDWEGEVRCKDDVTCASFSANHLVVKDFIIFALTPANVRSSPLLPIQHAHPIRLVTDGWTEQDLAHPEDR